MNVSASDWRLASRSSPLTAVTWRLPTGPKAARVSGSGFRQQARWIWKRRQRQRFDEPELRSFLRRTAAAERSVWYPRRRDGADPNSGDQHGDHLSRVGRPSRGTRSEEHTSELQSLMRISYAVFCL